MRAAMIGWLVFNTSITAVNLYFSVRTTRGAHRNLQLSQENTRSAQANLREHKASMSLTAEVIALAEEIKRERQ